MHKLIIYCTRPGLAHKPEAQAKDWPSLALQACVPITPASSITPPRRRGFTLTELLVVIAIIGVLLTLGAGATFKFIESQRVSGTENALRNMDKVLHAAWKKVVDDAGKNEDPSPAVFALAGSNADRARVLWIKFRLAEAFPQSYAEIRSTAGGASIYGKDAQGRPWIDKPKYMKQYAKKLPAVDAASHSVASESAACLYLALSVDRDGIMLDEANLAGYIGDTDNDGVKELMDNWGRPIRFQRFPIGNPDLASMNPRANSGQAAFGDPLDPFGLLQQDGWYTSNGTTFAGLVRHPFPPAPVGPQPYWVPFIASDGRDQTTGTSDDILSYRLKVGAAGY